MGNGGGETDRVSLGGGRQATFTLVGEGVAALMLAGGPGLSARYMRGTAELFHCVVRQLPDRPAWIGRIERAG